MLVSKTIMSNDELIAECQSLLDTFKYEELFASCDKILATNPEHLIALNYRGVGHLNRKEYSEAITYLDKAYKINPKEKYIAQNRIAILSEANMKQELEIASAEFQEMFGDDDYGLGVNFHKKLHVCDWTNYYEQVDKIKEGISKGNRVTVGFASGYFFDSPHLQTKANSIWMQSNYKTNNTLPHIGKMERKPKIRIGYFSADFYKHVCMNVLPHLFEVHDKDKFEIYAFSFSTIEDEMTARVEKAFDKYFRVADKSSEEIAKLAREMELDIAVDLNGLTGGGRPDMFSMRAAPIQVNFLGCPSSMPCDYMDYIIADHTLIPSDSRMHYSEKIIYMPDTYQPNDRTRTISDKVFTREELGLPKNAFIYSCFCSIAKLTPPIFDLWAEILKQVPNSILWLKKDVEESRVNLLKEAKARGIESRIVFAEPVGPGDEYMKMISMADVFLDTWPFSAHATCSDALWAGLPVISYQGESFPARVSSSVLHAAWMSELITKSKEEYVNLAVELGRNPIKLQVLRTKLERNKMICPLFNTQLYARYLEIGFIRAYERYQAGLAPEHIYIGA